MGLVVKYSGEASGIIGESEAEWYLSRARISGRPVLDLACGTGRLALLLAKEGVDVTGINLSQGILNQFRSKLEPDLKDPTYDVMLKSEGSGGRGFEERGRCALSNSSGVLLVEQLHAGNMVDQTVETPLRVTRMDVEGNVVEKGESTWMARYLFRHEAIHFQVREVTRRDGGSRGVDYA